MQKAPGILPLLNARINRIYALRGAIIAVIGVIVATFLVVLLYTGFFTTEAMIRAQSTNLGLWIVDAMPPIFAAWGFLAGVWISWRDGLPDAFANRGEHPPSNPARQLQISNPGALENKLVDAQAWAARFGRAARKADKDKNRVAVLVIDFNHFHEALTHWGRATLSKTFGARLQSLLRPQDSLRHLGGDEFVVLIPELSRMEEINYLGERLSTALCVPLRQGSQEIRIRAFQGASFYPDHGLDADNLLEKARIARQETKARNQSLLIFNEYLDNRTRWNHLQEMDALQTALYKNELCIRYAVQINTSGKPPTHVRAMPSWQKPDGTILESERIWTLATRAGITRPLLQWLLRTTLRDRNHWQQSLHRPFRINLPLPTSAWLDPALVEELTKHAADDTTPDSNLTLECSGELLGNWNEAPIQELQALHATGTQIALSEYGSAQGATSALACFPFDEVRLAPGLTAQLADNERIRTLVVSLLTAAGELATARILPGLDEQGIHDIAATLPCERLEGTLLAEIQDGDTLLPKLRDPEPKDAKNSTEERNPAENENNETGTPPSAQ